MDNPTVLKMREKPSREYSSFIFPAGINPSHIRDLRQVPKAASGLPPQNIRDEKKKKGSLKAALVDKDEDGMFKE
jgi:hypothetical protein